MRNITITRRKTFVGCLGKIKIYIEDPLNGDTVIDGVSCSFLGALKNNETKTFTVGTGPLRVFAIYDKLSKGYCFDSYLLPAGEEDICLSGKSQFNPFSGNPFYFDGAADSQALAGRERGTIIGIVVFVVCVAVGVVGGTLLGILL